MKILEEFRSLIDADFKRLDDRVLNVRKRSAIRDFFGYIAAGQKALTEGQDAHYSVACLLNETSRDLRMSFDVNIDDSLTTTVHRMYEYAANMLDGSDDPRVHKIQDNLRIRRQRSLEALCLDF
jgi:hypothetical protein